MAMDGEVWGSVGSGAATGASVAGPWGALAGGALGLVSGLSGSRSRRAALAAQEAAKREAIAGQGQARTAILGREQPYGAVGAQGLNALSRFNYRPTTAADVYSDPGYQFAQAQGIRGLEGTAAARGGLYSGAAGKALIDFSQGNANKFFQAAFDRNQTDTNARFGRATTTAGFGERSIGRQNAADQHYADMTGGYLTGYGNTAAAANLADGRASQNALSMFGGSLMNLFGGQGGGGGGGGGNVPMQAPAANYGSGGTYNPGWYADGGPVMVDDGGGRMVPKVGMRTPRPGQAAGGAMSREAILQALDAAASAPAPAASQPPRYRTLRDLQTEKALRDAGAYNRGGPVLRKNYLQGGRVTGPGGVDQVPAWLTNNEHVLTAPEVAALGGGDPAAGHNALMMFRRQLLG